MKSLLKVMLILGVCFALTFVLANLSGVLTVEKIQSWLRASQDLNPWWVAGLVVFFLFLDIAITVPTLSVTLFAGFSLGFAGGAAAALIGVSLAALTGYAAGRRWGDQAISFLVKSELEQANLRRAYAAAGPLMIVLSRAAPIVPEVTACLAGATRMPLPKYLVCFGASTLPYVAIASYAGSISSVDSPQPAIYASLGLYGVLWSGWLLFRRASRTRAATSV